MRTLTIYNYSELPPEAQAKALKNVRDRLEEEDDGEAFRWAIDDCALFEPAHDEMVKLFGPDYYERNGDRFMFMNTRKNISLDYGRLVVTEALTVTNTTYFLSWLGIPERLHKYVFWEIETSRFGETELCVWHDLLDDNPVGKVIEKLAEKASDRFGHHLALISERIESGQEEYFSDENVADRIENDECWEFEEDGSIFE